MLLWCCVSASGQRAPVLRTARPMPNPLRIQRAQPARVETHSRAHAAGARAAVTQKYGDTFVGVAGHHPCGRQNRAALIFQLDGVFGLQAQPLGGLAD